MDMAETDPIREAIEQGWDAIVSFDTGGEPVTVSIVAATEAYLAYEERGGDHIVVPWWQIEKVVLKLGAKRAL